MSALSDIILVGAVAGVGWYLYNSSKPVEQVVDTAADVVRTTVAPNTLTKDEFKKKSRNARETIEDLTGVDIPDLPDAAEDLAYASLKDPLPVPVTIVRDYAVEQIEEERKKPLTTIVQDVTQSKVSNPGNTLAGLVTDVVTGNYKWTGFKLPF